MPLRFPSEPSDFLMTGNWWEVVIIIIINILMILTIMIVIMKTIMMIMIIIVIIIIIINLWCNLRGAASVQELPEVAPREGEFPGQTRAPVERGWR